MSVLLKKTVFEGISQQELAQQIESKKKCRTKLPTWFETPEIYYPKKVNIEQTSSEIAAAYKSKIVSGKSLADLTGGLGIDSFYFSKKFESVFHFEINKNLHEIASHNFKILKAENIQTFAEDGLEFLKSSQEEFDWLYIDPSRRNKTKGKVFQLSDCEPDLTRNLELLFSKSKNLLFKTSPLLDLSIGLKEFENVKEIHVIAINNEVKELLWVLERGFKAEIQVKTVNCTKSDVQTFGFLLSAEKNAISKFSLPLSYLYEPNAAILKSGAFKSIGLSYNIKKLNPNTHLYTSDEAVDFTGRRFKIINVVTYNKKNFKKLNVKKANITTRNFPDNVPAIRKKFKIKEGGDLFLFFFKDTSDRLQMALCQKN